MTPSRRTRRLRRSLRNATARERLGYGAIAVTLLLTATGAIGVIASSTAAPETPYVVTATGDLGSSVGEIKPVADLMNGLNPDKILLVGDLVYPDGCADGYNSFFNTVYGPVKSKILAAPGNHDYHSVADGKCGGGNPAFYGYFSQSKCFGAPLGNGWNAITINTEEPVNAGSACELSVKSYLASHSGQHFVAITHHPRYTGGSSHGDFSALDPLVTDLDNAGTDLFLAGHNHLYERFGPMGAGGALRAEGLGIRFFTVGTGGNGLYSCTSHTGRQSCIDTKHGALRLELNSTSFAWSFKTTDGQTLDAGSAPTRTNGVTPSTTSSSSSTSSSTTSSTSSSSSTTSSSTTTSTTGPTTTSTTLPGGSCQALSSKYGLTPWAFTFTSGACATGGTAWGAWPYATTPWETFHHTGAYTIKGPSNFTVKNSAAVNYGDGFRVEAGGQGFTFDHVYGAYLHDDAFENDWNQGGTIKNSHVEAYVIYSAKASAGQGGDGSANTVTLSGNYFELKPTPTVYKGAPNLSGPWFKLDANSPQLVVKNNVFVASTVPPFGTLDAPAFKSCSGNTVIWRGAGEFPGKTSWLAHCPDTKILTTP